jgi:hypothetical protein
MLGRDRNERAAPAYRQLLDKIRVALEADNEVKWRDTIRLINETIDQHSIRWRMLMTFSDDEDVKHGLSEQAETKTEEYQAVDEFGNKLGKPSLEKFVCSCGSERCMAISVFGLPRPMFHGEIEPIQSQGMRDQRARVLKSTLWPSGASHPSTMVPG